LSPALAPHADPERRRAAEAFIHLFDRAMYATDYIRLRTSAAGEISLLFRYGRFGHESALREERTVETNPALALALWEMWLGDHPVQRAVRSDLVRFLKLALDETRDQPVRSDADSIEKGQRYLN